MSRGNNAGVNGRRGPTIPKPKPTEEAVLTVLRGYYGVDLTTLAVFKAVQELRAAGETQVIDALWALNDRGDVSRLGGPLGSPRWRIKA